MADPKHRFPQTAQPPGTEPEGERRRLGRVVHDHKGTATVQWHDAPADYERPVLEIEVEGARAPAAPLGGGKTKGMGVEHQTRVGILDPPKRGLSTGSLSIERKDSHNPYTRTPETDRQRASGTRTDLRKLSAWIKLMRSLEEAKKRRDE